MTKAAREITKINEKSKKSRNQSCENHQGENHEKREKHENREKHEKREINTKNALMATKSAPTAPKKHEQREFSKMHTRSHRKRTRKCPRLPGKRHIPWKTYVFFWLCLPLTSRLVAVLLFKQNGPCHKGNIASFLKTEITPAAALPCC